MKEYVRGVDHIFGIKVLFGSCCLKYMLKYYDEFTRKYACQGQRGGLGLISLS
jgi:hypothetical protein